MYQKYLLYCSIHKYMLYCSIPAQRTCTNLVQLSIPEDTASGVVIHVAVATQHLHQHSSKRLHAVIGVSGAITDASHRVTQPCLKHPAIPKHGCDCSHNS